MAKKRKMSKKEKIRRLKKFAKKYNVPDDLIDWKSIVDKKLSYQENKKLIIPFLKSLTPKPEKQTDYNKGEGEHFEAQMELMEKEVLRQEMEKAIEKIKDNKNVEIDKYFAGVQELIKIVVKGKANGLILLSDAGLGKTYQVLQTLADLGLKLGKDYEYVNTYTTALELYNMLYKLRKKIIVLDDIENILGDIKSVSILKSALWSTTKKRVVSYFSTTEKREAPTQFEFQGKIILCLNEMPKQNKKVIQSLVSRTLSYHIDFDYQTKMKIMYEMAKSLGYPFEVVDFIKEKSNEATESLNFRTLIQIALIRKYYKENKQTNGVSWKKIGSMLLKENPELSILLKLIKSGKSVSSQIVDWKKKTGMSRRSYFRYKRRLKKSAKVPSLS